MAARSSRDVVVRFVGDYKGLDDGAVKTTGRLQTVATSFKGIAAAGGAIAGVSFFGTMISEARDAERVGRQTEAVLRSTGGAANLTAKQIGDLAGKLSEKTAVDDEVIQHGQNVLLTFTRIRNEAGAGNDIFTQTTQIALDMSAALSETGDASDGLQGNITRLGKALNDPIAGISALTKVGVAFTEEQKAQIRALTESGDVLGAQKLILQELQTEFGGMAEASADSIGKAQVSWGNFAEEVGGKVLPAVNAVSNWALTTGIPTLGNLAGVVGDAVTPVFRGAAAAGGELVDMWQALPGPVQAGAIAMVAWALAGDRISGFLGRTTGPLKNFGEEMRLQQGLASLAGQDVSRFGAGLAVLERNVPAIARMGEAFRTARGDTLSFGTAARGVAAASISGLKTAAGGLMGVLGGPWGLAIGVATTLIGVFATRNAKAEQEQQRLADAGKEVSRVIAEQGGHLNATTREAAAKTAEDEGMLKLAEDLGISLPRVTDAVEGQKGAYERLKNQLQGVIAAKQLELQNAKEVRGSSGKQEAIQAEIDQYQGLLDKLNGVVGSRDSDVAAQRRQAAATSATSSAASTAITSTEIFRRVIESTGVEFDEAAGLGNQLAQAIRAITDEETSGIEAEEAYHSSLRALTESIRQNGVTLDIHTAKGQNNRDMLEDVASKIRDKTLADIQSGVPMNQAIARHDRRVAALRREAVQTFGAKSEAVRLIDAYSKIPKDVRTAIRTQGYEEVKNKLDVLYAQQIRLEGKNPVPLNLGAVRRESRGGFATGGPITGPGGPTSDVIPIWASAGEFMQRAAAVDYYGVPFMNAINQKKIPKGMVQGLAKGGMVWPFVADVSKTRIPKVGGPALSWAKSQAGKPYIWGGVGPGGYDCSGFMSAITNVIQKRNPHSRRFATGSFPTGDFAKGAGRFSIGFFRGNPGHMAGTLNGVNVESRGGEGVVVGPRARGAGSGLFGGNVWHLRGYARGGLVHGDPPFDLLSPHGRHFGRPKGFRDGGWLKPGQLGVNETSRPEPVLSSAQWDKLDRLIDALEKGGLGKTFNLNAYVSNTPADVATQFRRMEMMESLS